MTENANPGGSEGFSKLSRTLRDLNHWYAGANWVACAFALLIASYLVVLPQAFLSEIVDAMKPGPGSKAIDAADFAGRVLLGSVLAPVVETAFLQWAPVRLLRGVMGWGSAATVLTSAALFAATHPYSWGYVVFSFLIGLVLAYGFLARSHPGGKAFRIVAFAHAVRNFVATVASAL